MKSKSTLLAERIYDFVDNYAIKNPKYSGDDEKHQFITREPYELLLVADYLSHNKLPKLPTSNFENGAYIKAGKEEHDFIISELKALIKPSIQRGVNFII